MKPAVSSRRSAVEFVGAKQTRVQPDRSVLSMTGISSIDARKKELLRRLRAIDAQKAKLSESAKSSGVDDDAVILVSEKPASKRASSRARNSNKRRSTPAKRKGTTKGPPKNIPQQVIDLDAEPSVAPSAAKKVKSSKAAKSQAVLPKRQSTRVRRPRTHCLPGDTSSPNQRSPMPTSMSKCKRIQFCKRLVTTMLKDIRAAPFSAPVNELWPEQAIPRYFDVITSPMDLRTIKKKLETTEYLSPTPKGHMPFRFEANLFAADVRLVFRNAMVYNRVGDALYNSAQDLMEDFNRTIREELPLPPSPEEIAAQSKKKSASKSRKDRSRIDERATRGNSDDDDDEIICLSEPAKPVSKTKKSKKRGAAKSTPTFDSIVDTMDVGELKSRLQYLQDCRVPVLARTPVSKGVGYLTLASHLYEVPVTYKEKCRITESLGKVPSGKLEALINMIKRSQAQIDVRSEEFEFDMDSLDNPTLRNIEAFLEQFVPGFKTVRSSTLGREFTTVQEVDEEIEAAKRRLSELKQEEPTHESNRNSQPRVVRQPKSFFNGNDAGHDSSSDESSDDESDSDSDDSDESDAE